MFIVVMLYGFNSGNFDFIKKGNKNRSVEQTKEEEKIKRTDYTRVARKTLDWIDKQRNEEGWYILGKTCGPKDCEQVEDDKEIGNKDGLIATWSRLNFYKQHQDLKDLEIVKKDIDLFYDKYKDDNLKDSLWICKITYEMAQSKYIEQGQKDKLKELCFNTEDLDDEGLNNYWLDHFKREISSKYPPMTWGYYSLYERYFDNFFGSITDLIYKFLWSGDKEYLVLVDKYFIEEEKLIINKKGIDSQNKCLFGISVLDIYKHIDKSKTRLDYAINFYKALENDDIKDYVNNSVCGLFSRDIYEITREIDFLKKINTNIELIIRNNQREERGEIEDGFVRSDLSKGGFRPDRNVVENSLIFELIR